jgi:hypothetical protein
MITVQLKGGLGNQLFQYATARSLAHYHRTAVAFDLSLLSASAPNITKRDYELAAFGIAPVGAPLLDRLYRESKRPTYQMLVKPLTQWLHPVTEYREKSFRYDPDIWKKTSANTHLVGYFQSELYFKEVRALLLRELMLIQPPLSSLAASIQSTVSVSLHIRRGDYVSNPNARQFHGLCSVQYYNKAVEYLAGKVGDICLFIFSDDQVWAQNNLFFHHPTTFVQGHEAADSYKDMQLMSMCKHHIVANSSFSWWGAWLNPSPYKIVIAPEYWFADKLAQLQSQDIIPTAWIRM